jgi:hypothetical protein
MTAIELYKIRTALRQSPAAMGELLGVCPAAYYRWEKTGKIKKSVAIAARFLATQAKIAETPTESIRPIKDFRARFLPGARFGKLVIVKHLPRPRGNRYTCVLLECDCGNQFSLQTRELENRSECGDCRAADEKTQTMAPATLEPEITRDVMAGLPSATCSDLRGGWRK